MKILVCFFIFWVLSTELSYSEGIDTLKDVGKGLEENAAALREETEAFNKVKKGIESNAIKKGMEKDLVIKKFGKPVVISPEANGNEKWVYKPSWGTMFKGPKVYLFFDDIGKLENIRTFE